MEICLNDVFGAVCDSGWDEVDSQVVCNMLGYNAPFYRKQFKWTNMYVILIMVRNLNTKLGAVPLFGQYSNYRGPINYQDVQCSGNESSLSFCNRSLISDPSCTNTSRIAGVQCIEGTQTNSFILIVFLTINFCVTNSQSLLNASTLTQV